MTCSNAVQGVAGATGLGAVIVGVQTVSRGDQVGRHRLPCVLGGQALRSAAGRYLPFDHEKTRPSVRPRAGGKGSYPTSPTLKMLVFYLAVLPQFLGRTHHSPHSSRLGSATPRFFALPSPCRHRSCESPPRTLPPARASRTRCHDRRRAPRLWRQARGGRQVGAQPPSGTASARTEKDHLAGAFSRERVANCIRKKFDARPDSRHTQLPN